MRHGLTAETVIDALEDANDYAAFELAVSSEYDAQTVIERELVFRLASLLWRLRRAALIESGLFKIQARQLLQFRQSRQAHRKRQEMINSMYQNAVPTNEPLERSEMKSAKGVDASLPSSPERSDVPDDLASSFVRLCNLPTYPLDRLARYEATLWRQACQALFTLQSLGRRKPTRR